MKQINVFERGDRVCIEYEVDELLFRNGRLFYKLKNPATGKYLDNAYTVDELIAMPDKKGVEIEREEISNDQ